jgi:hypothetical protein
MRTPVATFAMIAAIGYAWLFVQDASGIVRLTGMPSRSCRPRRMQRVLGIRRVLLGEQVQRGRDRGTLRSIERGDECIKALPAELTCGSGQFDEHGIERG